MLVKHSIHSHHVLPVNILAHRQPSPLVSHPSSHPRQAATYHRHQHRQQLQQRHILLPHASLQSSSGDTQSLPTTVRINKCFREFASRREADRFVEDGRVMVNGVIAVSGQRVQPGDRITLDGKEVNWEMLAAELATTNSPSSLSSNSTTTSTPSSSANSPISSSTSDNECDGDSEDDGSQPLPLEDRFHYIKYWKPRGVVCTCDRTIKGNILDALPRPPPGVRLFTVGRLDKDSTGLILLTSDGRLPNASLRSREGHAKLYRVTADRPIPDEDCAQLASGVVITTVAQRDRGVAKELTAPTLPCRVRRDDTRGRRLLIELKEGRNRQIRKMLYALGYDTMELHRVEFMGIGLGDMWEGEWKSLNEEEMRILRRAVRAAEVSSSAAVAVERDDVGMQ